MIWQKQKNDQADYYFYVINIIGIDSRSRSNCKSSSDESELQFQPSTTLNVTIYERSEDNELVKIVNFNTL